ncbi:hypothetical protein F4782DRAFT_526678 [Xylaria castorea]|nr:hypothetical protein F4782DRAFT_526678 [Xylaria castorea]
MEARLETERIQGSRHIKEHLPDPKRCVEIRQILDRCVLQPVVNNFFGLLEFSEASSNSPKERSNYSTHFLADLRREVESRQSFRHIEALRASLACNEYHMDSLLDTLEDQSPRWQHRSDGPVAKQRRALCDRDAAVPSAGLHPLRQRDAASLSALKYMAERTLSQSHVTKGSSQIFALRAQEESPINREIAEMGRDGPSGGGEAGNDVDEEDGGDDDGVPAGDVLRGTLLGSVAALGTRRSSSLKHFSVYWSSRSPSPHSFSWWSQC